MVAARRGGKSCVEIVTDRLRPGNVDISWKVTVRTQQPTPAAAFAVCIEMHDLAGCVDTGVRSASADDLNVLVRDLA